MMGLSSMLLLVHAMIEVEWKQTWQQLAEPAAAAVAQSTAESAIAKHPWKLNLAELRR